MHQESIFAANKHWLRNLLIAAMVALAMATSLTVANASPAEAAVSTECLSDYKTKIGDAKTSYKEKCGMTWSETSTRHGCGWSRNAQAWICYGPKGDTSPSSQCYGRGYEKTVAAAKTNFNKKCGDTWNRYSGRHYCRWDSQWQGHNCWRDAK